jgi:hypothetical protein
MVTEVVNVNYGKIEAGAVSFDNATSGCICKLGLITRYSNRYGESLWSTINLLKKIMELH